MTSVSTSYFVIGTDLTALSIILGSRQRPDVDSKIALIFAKQNCQVETDRQTDRQTDRDKDRDREADRVFFTLAKLSKYQGVSSTHFIYLQLELVPHTAACTHFDRQDTVFKRICHIFHRGRYNLWFLPEVYDQYHVHIVWQNFHYCCY